MIEPEKKSKLHEAISGLIVDRLRLGFKDKSLNHTTCVEIYQMVFDTVVEVIQGAQLKLTNEFVNYVAQQYYDSVTINGGQELDPSIFSQRAKLEEIDTTELRFLGVFFRGTDHIVPIIHELRKRS
jgi:hypothetical protein